ncbi:MarR family transcriptional regulator [Paraburkholderia terrae]|uniref:MarR family winged helix-turn-helix transcriptional regulator n=1 Tax=Paraburkholderia terrae TaxID=311230 RepID=UPI0030E58187
MNDSVHGLFTYKLHAIKKLTDRITSEAFERKLSLTLPEARILLNVGELGPVSISDLAVATHLDRSRVSRASDILERRGFVQRNANAQDGRGVELTLTEAGCPLYEQAVKIATSCNRDILSVLSAQDRRVLHGLFDVLIRSFNGPDR